MIAPREKQGAFRPEDVSEALKRVADNVRACIQCGTCSGTCPNEFAMTYTPRHLWRLVMAGMADEIFKGNIFALCSSCYHCSIRCPRGLPLTETMAELKRLAAIRGAGGLSRNEPFYPSFLDNIRRNGRVNETELMTLYFLAKKNPAAPMHYLGLGMKFAKRGKIRLPFSSGGGTSLENLFQKVRSLEAGL